MSNTQEQDYWACFDRLNKAQRDFSTCVARRLRYMDREIDSIRRSQTYNNRHNPHFSSEIFNRHQEHPSISDMTPHQAIYQYNHERGNMGNVYPPGAPYHPSPTPMPKIVSATSTTISEKSKHPSVPKAETKTMGISRKRSKSVTFNPIPPKPIEVDTTRKADKETPSRKLSKITKKGKDGKETPLDKLEKALLTDDDKAKPANVQDIYSLTGSSSSSSSSDSDSDSGAEGAIKLRGEIGEK